MKRAKRNGIVKKPGKRGASDHDVQTGNRLRILRLERNMSQSELGDRLEVSFQQVQKYEKGVNRISGGRLTQIAQILAVPLSDLMGDSRHKVEPIDPTIFKIDRALKALPERFRAPLLQYIKAIGANE